MTKTVKFSTSLIALVFLGGAAFAQTAAPAAPTTPPKAVTPAVMPPSTNPPAVAAPKPAAPAPTTAAQTVNLNTAAESELDKLPQVGPARAKAIIEARTKGGKFKNWDDFVARNVVPKNAEEAIKTLVKF